MKMFSKKGVLLFAAAMAVCAFVLPATASAASWGPIDLSTTLHSSDLGFTATSAALGGGITSSCTRSSFGATVASAQVLEITTASLGGHCVANLAAAGGTTCTITTTSTILPWTATATTTSNIQIHGVRIVAAFENTPGSIRCSNAGITGISILITGTLTGGRWTGNAVGQRSIVFSNAEGLVSHNAITGENGNPVTVRGTLASTAALTVS